MSRNTLAGLALAISAAATGAFAQAGDASAHAMVEEAKNTLKSPVANRGQVAERMLREALAIPGLSAAGNAEVSTTLALFLLSARQPVDAIRPLAESAIQGYTQPSPDDPRLALPLEILASVSQDGSEVEALRLRASAIRTKNLHDLQAHMAPLTSPAERITRAGGPPKLRFRQEPEYSDDARIARKQGGTLLTIVVDEKGDTRDIRLVRSLGFGLDEAALQAVSTWKFEPPMLDGKVVPITANVEINFRLL